MWVTICDPSGRNTKEHPVVIVSRDSDIKAREEVVGVVASWTSALKNPRPDSYIGLPFSRDGKGATGFTKDTVAVCAWVVKIKKAAIAPDKIGGRVSPRHVREIVLKLKEIDEQRAAARRLPTAPALQQKQAEVAANEPPSTSSPPT